MLRREQVFSPLLRLKHSISSDTGSHMEIEATTQQSAPGSGLASELPCLYQGVLSLLACKSQGTDSANVLPATLGTAFTSSPDTVRKPKVLPVPGPALVITSAEVGHNCALRRSRCQLSQTPLPMPCTWSPSLFMILLKRHGKH